MSDHKSITCLGLSVWNQIKQIMASEDLKGRLFLCQNEGLEWYKFQCIVPLAPVVVTSQNFTTIMLVLRFWQENQSVGPGIYIDSKLIPEHFQFINLTDDILECESRPWTAYDLVLKLLQQIDSQGLVQWSKKAFEIYFTYNKLDVKQIHSVNLISSMADQNKNVQNKNKNYDFQQTQRSVSKTHQLKTKEDQLNLSFKQIAFVNHINNLQQKQQLLIARKQQCENTVNKNIVPFEKTTEPTKLQDDLNICSLKLCKEEQKNQSDRSHIVLSAFSSFKLISHNNKFSFNSQFKNSQQIEGLKSFKSAISSFAPYRPVKSEPEDLYKSFIKFDSRQSSNYDSSSNLNLNIKLQDINLNQYAKASTNTGERGLKHPKPMNKNANLPKFLIRIFIKYIDKFKSMYAKRQYDRLYSECKRMKEWKKNDRRQHAFGLKHLKNFFQDTIQGFPVPQLNRKVISKIINHYLLEQICQNSQIPQSHRSIFNKKPQCFISWKNTIKMSSINK